MTDFEEGWYYFTEGDDFGCGPGVYNLRYEPHGVIYKYDKKLGWISWSEPDFYLKLLKDNRIQKLTDDEVMIKDIIE
jgi:hypothetical protein